MNEVNIHNVERLVFADPAARAELETLYGRHFRAYDRLRMAGDQVLVIRLFAGFLAELSAASEDVLRVLSRLHLCLKYRYTRPVLNIDNIDYQTIPDINNNYLCQTKVIKVSDEKEFYQLSSNGARNFARNSAKYGNVAVSAGRDGFSATFWR